MQKDGSYPGRYLAILEEYGNTAKAVNQESPNSAGAEITEESEGQQERLPEVYQQQKKYQRNLGAALEWGE